MKIYHAMDGDIPRGKWRFVIKYSAREMVFAPKKHFRVIFSYIFVKTNIFKNIKKVRIIRIQSGIRVADQKYSYFAPEGRENFGVF